MPQKGGRGAGCGCRWGTYVDGHVDQLAAGVQARVGGVCVQCGCRRRRTTRVSRRRGRGLGRRGSWGSAPQCPLRPEPLETPRGPRLRWRSCGLSARRPAHACPPPPPGQSAKGAELGPCPGDGSRHRPAQTAAGRVREVSPSTCTRDTLGLGPLPLTDAGSAGRGGGAVRPGPGASPPHRRRLVQCTGTDAVRSPSPCTSLPPPSPWGARREGGADLHSCGGAGAGEGGQRGLHPHTWEPRGAGATDRYPLQGHQARPDPEGLSVS